MSDTKEWYERQSIATKRGDHGETDIRYGVRVSKAHVKVEACGSVDEMNSYLGLARAHIDDPLIKGILLRFQEESLKVGADIAMPIDFPNKVDKVTAEMIDFIEKELYERENNPDIMKDWAFPGRSKAEAFMDVARTACRRAERNVVVLMEEGLIANKLVIKYLNRLSDLLWIIAREIQVKEKYKN